MVAGNHLCGVGVSRTQPNQPNNNCTASLLQVAHNASLGGLRMLDGTISDQLEARALSFALDQVDIFSSSWGPSDDGETVEGPGRLAAAALEKGAREGRAGRGVIYVWASGNGGIRGDDCSCDGYAGSIYTVSVSSASQQGAATWYGESCPSTLASTYSSGAYTDQKIATTDVGGGCTVSHTGTSAAAPLAAGVLALVLEAAPHLTWRDVQHLVVRAADPTPLTADPGWRANGAGLQYNPRFGFGILDAERIVQMALSWQQVGKADQCEVAGQRARLGARLAEITEADVAELVFTVEKNCHLKSLEHLQLLLRWQTRTSAVHFVTLYSLYLFCRLQIRVDHQKKLKHVHEVMISFSPVLLKRRH